jgi:uncharacterized Ntn-hydrolase superfamily protein
MLAEIEMTLSIVARCPDSGQFGVSATTALPAVGKLLTHAHPDAGAVATQARINPYLGIDGIRLLADGHDAAETIERLRGTDPCMNRRQLGLVDRTGTAAAWTGEDCIPYAGARTGEGVTVQGNRLEGPHVLDAAMDVFLGGAGRPLVARLVEALAAGVAAGGRPQGGTLCDGLCRCNGGVSALGHQGRRPSPPDLGAGKAARRLQRGASAPHRAHADEEGPGRRVRRG